MLSSVLALTTEYAMLPPGATVLCALSGGADSMCLIHLLSQWEGITVHAAHFDHNLRGAESARDAAFVTEWCAQRGIPLHLGSAQVAQAAKERRQGIEETARQLRYEFLCDTAEAIGAEVIATAHNAGDNAETLLMNLLRGSGLQGLTGIPPRQGRLVRPLLSTTRAEIMAYLEENRIPHVEDSSNQSEDYLRNRVRHRLIPLLEEWNPGFTARTVSSIPTLRADNDYLLSLASPIGEQAAETSAGLTIPASLLAQAPGPVAVRAARLLLARANGGDTDFSQSHLEALLSLARSADPSGEVHLPRGLTARREYERLILTREGPPEGLVPFTPVQGENPIPGAGWTALLDVPPWPGLIIRSRQTGDVITLPGRPEKSLKKLFIDQKVPQRMRQRVPVAADHDGVIAVAGFGPNTPHPRSVHLQFIKTEKVEGET